MALITTLYVPYSTSMVLRSGRWPSRIGPGEDEPCDASMIWNLISGKRSGSTAEAIEILSGARSAVAHGQKISTVAGRHHADVATKRKQTKTTRYRSFVAMTRSDGPRENPTRQCN